MEKPKYKIDDRVTFTLGDKVITGTVAIIDAYGTFENPNEVSYDIIVDLMVGIIAMGMVICLEQ